MEFENSFLPEPMSGCFLWMQGCTSKGYGEIVFKGKTEYAHRVSAHIFLGMDLCSPAWVLHKCDVPSCVNPKHLFLGNAASNNVDMSRKGRAKNQNSLKTHCKNGHLLSGLNLYRVAGKRRCQICMRASDMKARPWRYPNE